MRQAESRKNREGTCSDRDASSQRHLVDRIGPKAPQIRRPAYPVWFFLTLQQEMPALPIAESGDLTMSILSDLRRGHFTKLVGSLHPGCHQLLEHDRDRSIPGDFHGGIGRRRQRRN